MGIKLRLTIVDTPGNKLEMQLPAFDWFTDVLRLRRRAELGGDVPSSIGLHRCPVQKVLPRRERTAQKIYR